MKKTWVLYDSTDYVDEEQFRKMMIEDGEDPDAIDYWDWVSDALRDQYDNLRRQIERVFPYEECVVVGSVGLWYGRRDIEATKVRSVWDAIEKCCRSCEVVINQVNGHFEIEASHHDGTNWFEIYLLNDKGVYTQNGDLSNRRYHKAIKKCLWEL